MTTLPSNEKDRKKVRSSMEEISNSLTRIEAERDFINDVLDRMQEEFELPKKEMRKVSKIFHKRNIDEVVNEAETVEEIYNQLMV